METSGKLWVVPTPIGNLEDITLRALRILGEVDLVLAEDTRTSGRLLKHYEIATPLRAFHMHNEHRVVSGLCEAMIAGQHYALVSDAGTPAISDPGYLLVRHAIDAGVRVEVLPGATAFVPALVNSGLPAHRFCFEGFLPVKKGRKTKLEQLAQESATLIFYESPHRLIRSLRDMSAYFGPERSASLSREISKKFEETKRGSLGELLAWAESQQPKGEMVICVGSR